MAYWYLQKLSTEQVLSYIKHEGERFWSRIREERALQVFRMTARRVPAYKDFLRKNKINPDKIRNFKDFQSVPPISKKNYLQHYSFPSLCLDGSLKKPLVFTATSGSTGVPFYFPRSGQLDWGAAVAHMLFLEQHQKRSNEPALVLVCFGMGVWIGGLLTYKAFEIGSRWGRHPVSILTPGINKREIFNALRKFHSYYKQVIFVGYPPFIKDIIDDAREERINIKSLHPRFIFAAEPFTEKFRDYITKKAGIKNPYLDTMNIYGSADIGTMAFETPIAILVRRLAIENKSLFRAVFADIQKTPTLAQYNPLFITFESIEGEVLLTGNNTIPLVRYAIGDHGGTFSFQEVSHRFRDANILLGQEAKKRSVPVYQLPFIYIYERSDFATTLYGLQIYPEMIREPLLERPLATIFTGKFTMLTKFDKRQNQYLEINLETRKKRKIESHIKELVLKKIVANLKAKNSEYRELSHFLGKRALPILKFWPAEHPLYFKLGVKQMWVKKNDIIRT